MIDFIYGTDGYRVRQAVGQRAVQFAPGQSKPAVLDTADLAALSQLESAFKHVSLFSESRCIILRGVFAQKSFSQELSGLLTANRVHEQPDTLLIISETGADTDLAKKNKALFAFLTLPSVRITHLAPLSPAQLEQWVGREFSDRKAEVEPSALKLLVQLAGPDCWALVQEIDKLANWRVQGTVTVQDVRALVAERTEPNIFEFTDALSAKDRPRAMAVLYRELNTGRESYSILALIIHQFRNLLMVKDLALRSAQGAAIAQKVGVPPFVATKLLSAAKKFESSELSALYQDLLRLDTGAKQGRLDLADALYAFVLNTGTR